MELLVSLLISGFLIGLLIDAHGKIKKLMLQITDLQVKVRRSTAEPVISPHTIVINADTAQASAALDSLTKQAEQVSAAAKEAAQACDNLSTAAITSRQKLIDACAAIVAAQYVGDIRPAATEPNLQPQPDIPFKKA